MLVRHVSSDFVAAVKQGAATILRRELAPSCRGGAKRLSRAISHPVARPVVRVAHLHARRSRAMNIFIPSPQPCTIPAALDAPIIRICMLLAARRYPSHTPPPTDAPRAAPPWRQTTILGSNLVYVSRRTRWRRAFFNVAFLRSQFRSGCACGVCLVCSVGRGGRAQHGRRIILLFFGSVTVCV